jgi:hypothetical protein
LNQPQPPLEAWDAPVEPKPPRDAVELTVPDVPDEWLDVPQNQPEDVPEEYPDDDPDEKKPLLPPLVPELDPWGGHV